MVQNLISHRMLQRPGDKEANAYGTVYPTPAMLVRSHIHLTGVGVPWCTWLWRYANLVSCISDMWSM